MRANGEILRDMGTVQRSTRMATFMLGTSVKVSMTVQENIFGRMALHIRVNSKTERSMGKVNGS